jgi:hypothetical protein
VENGRLCFSSSSYWYRCITKLSQLNDKPQSQVVVNPKLSPQMVEDMEMLMVLGEDKVPYGS